MKQTRISLKQANNQNPNTVFGKVSGNRSQPLPGLKVEVYDADMRSWELLPQTITDKEGKYEVTWTHSQLSGKGKKEADIAIKVLTKEKGT